MPEQVTYDGDNRFIRVQAWGDDPISDWFASKQGVVELRRSRGTSMLLVDAREVQVAPPPFDILDFADAWPATLRTAILISRNTPSDIKIMETVALHRGKQVKIFFSRTEAADWLNGPSGQAPGD